MEHQKHDQTKTSIIMDGANFSSASIHQLHVEKLIPAGLDCSKELKARAEARRRFGASAPELPLPMIQTLVWIERRVRRSKTCIQIIRSIRNIIYFGLLRNLIRLKAKYNFESVPYLSKSSVLIFDHKISTVVSALKNFGVFAGFRLRPEIVSQLEDILPTLCDGFHIDVDEHYTVFDQIVSDPGVLQIVRTFLNCEPILLECKVSIGTVHEGDTLSSGFHFDHAGAPSLNLMVYLTDIDENTAPHIVIERTQTGKRFRDFFREMLPMSEAIQRFPSQIRTITGSAGTVIFENTETFHTRAAGHKRRAILNVLYSVRDKRLLSIVRTRRRLSGAAQQ